jgi:hypothetical protein
VNIKPDFIIKLSINLNQIIMKTKIFTFILSAMLSLSIAQSQTITSVTNGDFLTPSTWNCGCVPSPGDNIIINHHVVLNTNWGYSSGSLTINSGGSLVQDASTRGFELNGGTFTNNGSFSIDRFAAYNGTLTNSDSMQITQFLYNTATITNSGIIYNMDSLYNDNSLLNTNTGSISATNLLNSANLQNNGQMNLTNYTNSGTYISTGKTTVLQFLNSGTSVISDTVNINNDFTNAGNMTLDTHVVFIVVHDFLNSDTIIHHAVFNNNGAVTIGNDFTNNDTLKGNKGTFCVAYFSTNTGYFEGTIDFCGQTQLVNTGVIGPNVTSCTHTCQFLTGIPKHTQKTTTVNVYPNPFIDEVTFETSDNGINPEIKLSIFNILGQQVFSHVYSQNKITISKNDLNSGVYFYRIESNSFSSDGKLIAE